MRTNIIAAIAVVIVVAASIGVYVFTSNSPMTTAQTTSSSAVTTTYYATTYTTPFIITNTATSNNTETKTLVSNYTLTSTVPSEINSTISSVRLESSATPPCTTYSGQISTTTLSEQSTTTTEQVVYDGTTCNFGNNWFEPPSILIPADILVWTNFQLQESGSYNVGGSISYFPFPDAIGANITVAIYLNGNFIVNSTTPVPDNPHVTNSSLIPDTNSSNSIFALKGVTLSGGVGTQTPSTVSLNGATITIAMINDKPLWLSGWTQADMSQGTGPQFGQSIGQLNGTYEWPDSGLTLPNSLPQPTTTLTFELQFSGDYFA